MNLKTVFILIRLLGIMFARISFGDDLRPVNVKEITDRVHSYWLNNLNSGVINSTLQYDLSKTVLYPNLSANLSNQTTYLVPYTNNLNGTATFTLSQQLLNLSQWVTINAQKLSLESAQLDLEDQLLSLMKATVSTTYLYLTNLETLKILNFRRERLQKFSAEVHEVTRLRLTDSTSEYLIKSELAQLEINIAQADALAKSSLDALNVSLGNPIGTKLRIDESYVPQQGSQLDSPDVIAAELPNVQSLIAKASSNHQVYRAANFEYAPAAAISGVYSQSAYSNNPFYSTGQSMTVTGTLTWNVFDQGSRSIRAQSAEAQEETSRDLARARQLENSNAVMTILNQLAADSASYQSAKTARDLAKQGFDGLFALYSFGKTSFIAVKDAESTLINLEIQEETLKLSILNDKAAIELLSRYHGGRLRKSGALAID